VSELRKLGSDWWNKPKVIEKTIGGFVKLSSLDYMMF